MRRLAAHALLIGLGLAVGVLPASAESAAPVAEAQPVREAVEILGARVEPGSRQRLILRITESFIGSAIETPVLVAVGRGAGPTLCLVAGIHGDEVNGVEIVRRALLTLDLESLHGDVIAIPIANVAAFARGSRYLPDRRDLNRYFPGSLEGSSASRIAYGLFKEIIERCDMLVDFHTGSFHRTNLYQIRANIMDDRTTRLAHSFGAAVIVNNPGRPGTLRRAALDAGIPSITVEVGEPSRFDIEQVEHALSGFERLLPAYDMMRVPTLQAQRPSSTAYLRTRWIRCERGGILVSRVRLGESVAPGDVLGSVSDPLSGTSENILSPHGGRVIGMAVDQLVMPGFAAYHLGLDPRTISEESGPDSFDASDAATDGDPDGLELDERPE